MNNRSMLTAIRAAAMAALIAASPGRSCAEPLAELWVIDPLRHSAEDQTLAATLQGVVNREQAKVWLRGAGAQQRLLSELQREGTKIRDVADPWELVRQFRDQLKGVVLYAPGDGSLNVATTYCGLHGAIAVTESQLARAKAENLELLYDARKTTEQHALHELGAKCSAELIVHQPADKHYHLRDFAIARRAFVFASTDRDERIRTFETLGKSPLVYGWGDNERHFVEDASIAGGAVVPADWALNLSATQHLPAELPVPPRPKPAPAQSGERIVAFVMSDGDNVQWMTSRFENAPGFWSSPQRGEFKMNWEMPPLLAEVAPRILAGYLKDARERGWRDEFIAGPSGVAYYFPQASGSPQTWVERTAQALPRSRMSIVSMLGEGEMEAADPLLDRDEADAVFYKDYSPYNKYQGAVRWRRGKPCISYRFLLWEQSSEAKSDLPEGVARAVAQMPAEADVNVDSFALINVHAWSFREIGGPMEAVRRTIDLLPAGTRVVTAGEFVELISNLAPEDR